jgi:antitoxin YefM
MYKIPYMKAITYTQARQNLASTMDMVCEDCTPVTITRSGKQQAVVMLSLGEYDQLEETAHLMRSPANAKRLAQAIQEIAQGKGKEHKLNLG